MLQPQYPTFYFLFFLLFVTISFPSHPLFRWMYQNSLYQLRCLISFLSKILFLFCLPFVTFPCCFKSEIILMSCTSIHIILHLQHSETCCFFFKLCFLPQFTLFFPSEHTMSLASVLTISILEARSHLFLRPHLLFCFQSTLHLYTRFW